MTGVRSIAVVGRDASLWLAAIALQRAFGRTGLTVTAIEMPAHTRPRDAYATLPDLARFHKLLGIDERDLVLGADATFMMGQQYHGWSGDDAAFLHAYGTAGGAIAELPFLQFWIKARAAGLPATLEDFSTAATAARHGRMAPPDAPQPSSFGYHVDATAYDRLLRRRATGLGIAIVEDADPHARIADGEIVALGSVGGEIVADLYVDASGVEARLISALDPDAPMRVPRTSPCDRLLTATGPALSPLPLYSRIAAHSAGWIGLYPLGTRTAVTMAYASSGVTDDAAAGLARSAGGLRHVEDVAFAALPDATRLRPWVGNCVAVGAAASVGDPLDAVALQIDQIGITHLVSLIPIDRSRMVETGIYNDEVVSHYARLRDFQAAHYRLNGRRGEPFWDSARAAPVSDDLAYKLSLFAARGQNAQYNHETFNVDSWQAALIGHGLQPRSYDPQVDAVPDAEVMDHLRRLLRTVKDDVGAMIPHQVARERVTRP